MGPVLGEYLVSFLNPQMLEPNAYMKTLKYITIKLLIKEKFKILKANINAALLLGLMIFSHSHED